MWRSENTASRCYAFVGDENALITLWNIRTRMQYICVLRIVPSDAV